MMNNTIYELAKEKYINSKLSITKIAEEFNISRLKLAKYLRECGIDTSNKWRNYDEAKFISLYNEYKNSNKTIKQIAVENNIDKTFLARKIKQFSEEDEDSIAKKNKYSVNSNYFSVIDNEEKAYWLGFLYADGYNSNKVIQLGITCYDINHVRKFRKSLNATHKISYEESDHTSRIYISDKKLADDLNLLGCIRNKTYYGHFPGVIALPRIYLRHFIRGYFDGDGSMSKMICQEITSANSIKRKIDKVSFTIKTKTFSLGLINAIKVICGVEASFYYYEPLDRCEVYIEGQNNVRIFLDCIYKESTIYLDRKYAQYLRYILPSDLEIDQIISEKLSGEVLPSFEYDDVIPNTIEQSEPEGAIIS